MFLRMGTSSAYIMTLEKKKKKKKRKEKEKVVEDYSVLGRSL